MLDQAPTITFINHANRNAKTRLSYDTKPH